MRSELNKISNEDLINLLRQDHKYALDEIFNRFWEKLYRTAYKVLLDEDLSKDIVQEVLVRIWERRNEISVVNLQGYLIQAVKYKVISELRRGKFTERHERHLESLHFDNSTEQLMDYKELEEQIVHALKKVPKRCREVFYLSRFKNLSNKEIAVKANISIRTVETQISKALKYLRTQIAPSLFILIHFLPF